MFFQSLQDKKPIQLIIQIVKEIIQRHARSIPRTVRSLNAGIRIVPRLYGKQNRTQWRIVDVDEKSEQTAVATDHGDLIILYRSKHFFPPLSRVFERWNESIFR